MNTKLNFSKKDIAFNGTENEKKLKEELFDDSLLIAQKDDEIKELKNIIKEARKLLKETEIENSWFKQFKKKQLEILDKESNYGIVDKKSK